MTNKVFAFDELETADLIVDAIYEGGTGGNAGDDPLKKLMRTEVSGGFRRPKDARSKFYVLYTSGEDKDWPDSFDPNSGMMVYYGDNKKPGHELHETKKSGNALLRDVFSSLHSSINPRNGIMPFFIFQKYETPRSKRSVQFKGIAVPGYPGISSVDDLVAIWRTSGSQRFQNYKAIFTILDIARVEREWIDCLCLKGFEGCDAPLFWRKWKNTGAYQPLQSEVTTIIRSPEEQLPQSPIDIKKLARIYEHFSKNPIAFEDFSAFVFRLHDSNVVIDEVTRSAVDGGRDAIGRYLIGISSDPVYVDFSLEAKCYRPGLNNWKASTVGVKEVARLISRIRNRQFGVLVTTSIVSKQVYEEVRSDKHPIVFISGGDILKILDKSGYSSLSQINNLLSEYPVT